ncbi:MAG: glycosyltransferase family 4 protein [Anaerolineae bacterium]|nr:glycosyltransferase family 4 protein [Anaerolineae bacterium]
MKSLLITSTFPPRVGGREFYLHSIFSRFPPGDVVVMTHDREGDWQAFDQQSALRTFRMKQTDFYWYFRGRRARFSWSVFLGSLCLRERISVVHCGVVLPDGMSGWLLKRVFGKPYIVYTYAKEIQELLPTEWHWRNFQRTLQEADRIVTISNYTKDKLVKLGVDPTRIVMIYPGVDLGVFHPDPAAGQAARLRHGLSDEQLVLLTVARLVPRKGHDKVIEALPAILERVPDVVYLIVGTGPGVDCLRTHAQEKGVADRVIFVGQVPDEDLPAYYNAADVFIMPNREEGTDVEGFGIVFLEANACAKPVIGGRSGGTVDAVADGETGYLVDPFSPEAVAEAAVHLLTDPALARRMGERGQKRVQQGFSWDRAVRQVRELTIEVAAAAKEERVTLAHPARLAHSLGLFLQRL